MRGSSWPNAHRATDARAALQFGIRCPQFTANTRDQASWRVHGSLPPERGSSSGNPTGTPLVSHCVRACKPATPAPPAFAPQLVREGPSRRGARGSDRGLTRVALMPGGAAKKQSSISSACQEGWGVI
jgi:hypothetical protein